MTRLIGFRHFHIIKRRVGDIRAFRKIFEVDMNPIYKSEPCNYDRSDRRLSDTFHINSEIVEQSKICLHILKNLRNLHRHVTRHNRMSEIEKLIDIIIDMM